MSIELYKNVLSNETCDALFVEIFQMRIQSNHSSELQNGTLICDLRNDELMNNVERVILQICKNLYSEEFLQENPYIEYWTRLTFENVEFHRDCDEKIAKTNIHTNPVRAHILSLQNCSFASATWILANGHVVLVPPSKGSLTSFEGSLLHAVPRSNSDAFSMRPVILFNVWSTPPIESINTNLVSNTLFNILYRNPFELNIDSEMTQESFQTCSENERQVRCSVGVMQKFKSIHNLKPIMNLIVNYSEKHKEMLEAFVENKFIDDLDFKLKALYLDLNVTDELISVIREFCP